MNSPRIGMEQCGDAGAPTSKTVAPATKPAPAANRAYLAGRQRFVSEGTRWDTPHLASPGKYAIVTPPKSDSAARCAPSDNWCRSFTRSASVTVPATPSASPPPQPGPSTTVPPPPAAPIPFPLEWILANAAPPVQYRAVAEVARLAERVGGALGTLPLTHKPALMLAATQSADGTWNRAMLSVPGARAEHFEGVGTINAV